MKDDTAPKYVLVEKHIKQAIKNRTITDRLPGERTLAEELGFSYMTIRKAIENLVGEGILYKVPTKGTFVADGKTKKPKDSKKTIGYFLDSSIKSGISSPYYSLVFNEIEKTASKCGYSTVYFSEVSDENLPVILSRVDGVIATCLPRLESTIQRIKKHVPLVVLDNSSVDKSIPSVIIDNFNADLESVNYVYSLGNRRIGFVMGLEDSDVGKNRFAGYRQGLNQNGIGFDEKLVFRGNYSYESGEAGADYFARLAAPPTVIICANDSMAMGAMRSLHQHGIRVPDDMSIVGFDDIEVASQITPALTTVVAPIEKIATTASEMLCQLMDGKQPVSSHVALPANLIIRQTCARRNQSRHAAA
jgi:DNA-binding LacI/PurR family transcriptional regulator